MKWFVFPEKGNVSLKYTRDRDGQLHYVLTLPPGPGAPPGELVRNNWQQVRGRPKCWTLPIPRDNTAKFPMDYFRRMGARYQNFDLTNSRDRDRFHSAFCLSWPGNWSKGGTPEPHRQFHRKRLSNGCLKMPLPA